MPMRVVHVGRMRVGVSHALMAMPVGVGFARWIVRSVLMLMMLVMHVPVDVFHRLVLMLVFVNLREMQPDAKCHEKSSHRELDGEGGTENDHCSDGAEER